MRCCMIQKSMPPPNSTKRRCRSHTFFAVFPFLVPLFLPFVLPGLLSSTVPFRPNLDKFLMYFEYPYCSQQTLAKLTHNMGSMGLSHMILSKSPAWNMNSKKRDPKWRDRLLNMVSFGRNHFGYPLVICYIAMENHHWKIGKSHNFNGHFP